MSESTTAMILTITAALIAGVPPTLAALAAYRQAQAALRAADKAAASSAVTVGKADEQAMKTESLIGRVEQVHTLTNSNLAQVKAELATAAASIVSLTAIVAELRNQRQISQVKDALHTEVPTHREPNL